MTDFFGDRAAATVALVRDMRQSATIMQPSLARQYREWADGLEAGSLQLEQVLAWTRQPPSPAELVAELDPHVRWVP